MQAERAERVREIERERERERDKQIEQREGGREGGRERKRERHKKPRADCKAIKEIGSWTETAYNVAVQGPAWHLRSRLDALHCPERQHRLAKGYTFGSLL